MGERGERTGDGTSAAAATYRRAGAQAEEAPPPAGAAQLYARCLVCWGRVMTWKDEVEGHRVTRFRCEGCGAALDVVGPAPKKGTSNA